MSVRATQPQTWRQEFSEDFNVPDIISNDSRLDDMSWHNDTSPSFTMAGYDTSDGVLPDIRLWVNHPEKGMREYVEQQRFFVGDVEGCWFESEDEADAEKAIAALIAACTRAQAVRR